MIRSYTYLNVHTHQPGGDPGVLEIESLYFGQPYRGKGFLSVGLHPWYLSGISWETASDWLSSLSARPDVLAVGEAGLDKVTATPWADQLRAFELCYQASETAGKPLIIHCVRAYNEVLALHKSWKPAQAWVFHGFNKKEQIAAQIARAGCYASFGADLRKPAVQATFRNFPLSQVFLENDDQPIAISDIYKAAAVAMDLEETTLQAAIWENFNRVFSKLSPDF